jgi:hypothetical protein
MFELRGVRVTSPGKRINGTQDWTKVETTFDTEGQDSVIVAAMLGSRSARGNRGAKTREPMPDLIYGQFIEHLGRSIYGGICTEMLEDRKFYSAVGETRRNRVYVPSPWKAVAQPRP